jgi:Ca2+-binding EF-hand superfamily protein
MTPDEKEIIDKVEALVTQDFKGDYRVAFDSYDLNKDGCISGVELTALLYRANIGNRITRPIWCKRIIAKLANEQGLIPWSVFEQYLVHKSSPPKE